jgi:hypothetical protein
MSILDELLHPRKSKPKAGDAILDHIIEVSVRAMVTGAAPYHLASIKRFLYITAPRY